MALTFMVQTDKGNLIGRNNEGWKAHEFRFWYYNPSFSSDYYDGTRFELTAEEVLDLAKYKLPLEGQNVYVFEEGVPTEIIAGIQTNLDNVMDSLPSNPHLNHEELIELLEEYVDETHVEEYIDDTQVEAVEDTDKDMVNHPDHYTRTEREVIDTMRGAMTKEEFTGYLKGNILKYTLRMGLKDSVSQEAGKIKAYTDYLEMHLNDEWIEGAH